MSGVSLVVETLAQHRQEHDPSTGAATCHCGEWVGPYTMVADEHSFAFHLTDALDQAGVGFLVPAATS